MKRFILYLIRIRWQLSTPISAPARLTMFSLGGNI